MSYKFRGLTFDDFNEGDVFTTASRTISEGMVDLFAGLSGDFNPLHTDATFAEHTPFKQRVAHGMLTASVATGLANQLGIFEGTTLALLEQVTRYTGAVKFDDTVRLVLTVAEKKEPSKSGRGIITFTTEVKNQDDQNVIEGHWVLMMTRKS